MKRIVIAAVLGGLVMFVWGAVAHMLTPLGEAGMRSMPVPTEIALADALRGKLTEDGLYIFPGMENESKGGEEEEVDEKEEEAGRGREAWMKRYAEGPTGLLLYHPQPGPLLSAKLFGIELRADILVVGIAAWVAGNGRTYRRRLGLVAMFGLAAWLSIEVSYWNWYGFPSAYTLAQLVDQVGGFLCAGLVVAQIVRPEPPAAT